METILKMADNTVSCIYNSKKVNEMLIYKDLMDSQYYFIPTVISIFKGNPEVEVINYDNTKAFISFNDKYFIITIDKNDDDISITINCYDSYLEARRFYRWF
jgi:uncharacterized protein YdhG (YjbR/CyaY superfamily)